MADDRESGMHRVDGCKGIIMGEILSNTLIAPSTSVFDMKLSVPALFDNPVDIPKPGQFMMLYTGMGAHLLPRPISICETRPKEKILRLVYRAVGEGTRCFAERGKGAVIRMTGPLGNGFTPVEAPSSLTCTHILVVGGVGAPALLALAKVLYGRPSEPAGHDNREPFNSRERIIAVMGFRDRSDIFLADDFKQYCHEVHIATDNGSAGFHGNGVELLTSMGLCSGDVTALYACGPRPMLKSLVNWAETKDLLAIQVSMEERMACGIGACVGCAVQVKQAEGLQYRRVCKDGPVFDGRQVVL